MDTFIVIYILLISAYIDLKTYYVLVPLNILILIVGLFVHLNEPYELLDVLLGISVLPTILIVINKVQKDSIGNGDIELIASMGFYFGYRKLVISFFIAILSLALYSLFKKKRYYPLIPFLSFSFILILFITWYHDSVHCSR